VVLDVFQTLFRLAIAAVCSHRCGNILAGDRHSYGADIRAVRGTFRPHHHVEGKGFADTHNARSNDFGTLASLATCFHFGYHLEHHRRPDVPWWALPGAKKAGVGEVAAQREVTA